MTVAPGANWLVTMSSGCDASSAVPLTAVMMSPAWRPRLCGRATRDDRVLASAALAAAALVRAAEADGIQAPLSTGRLLACLTVGSIVSKRMPR